VSQPATHASRRASIWDREHFPVTTGSILAFTIIAFQGLALATVAPVVADDIGGRDLYGWIFTAFLLPQIVGTVFAGREVDRHSPGRVFAIHLALFTVGCVAAGAAPSIAWLFVGRAIQGFGAGGLSACIYAVLSRAYEDELRPSILAATSTAWVVPSLIGPAIAGYVAEEWSWRWAFFGLLPILAIVAPLTLPSYFRIAPGNTQVGNDRRLHLAVVLAIATGVFLAGLEVRPWAVGTILAVIGLAFLAPALKRLLPSGTFQAMPVMPAAILARGLGFGGFAVVETYLIFALKDFGGASAASAGVILTFASLTWTSGSWLQARWDRATGPGQRPRRLVVGFTILFAATLAMFLCVAVWRDIWLWAAFIGWAVAGLGIGLGYPTAVSLAFAHTAPGEEGLVSSSLLLLDLFAFSVGVGIGGVMLAVAEAGGSSTEVGTALAMGLGVAMILGSIFAATRTREPVGAASRWGRPIRLG
jgi:MFS family permease